VDFPTAHPTRHEKNNTVRGEYFQPRGVDNAPLAIILHGVGDFSLVPCKLLARTLARKGIASFVLYLIMHSSRMTESARKRFPHLTSQEWFENHQISVIDLRQVVDWANSRPEINDEHIAAIGISFGGFVSAIAMGVDERIKAGVFIVTGGNSNKIGWERRASDFSEVEYQDIQSAYRQYLDEIAEKGFENVTPPREDFLIDPMTFAHLLRQRPILMINARWDEAIPKEATLDFWEEAGKPAIAWFPATHPTIWLWYPFIRRKIISFLKSVFG
jgi:esterase/lipase